ncbi:unnamed protein product [Anisakis simplex]|uniref:Napsin-A (inferred by orthology to a human protein) n=1 Tax=Anisakis simplex TaxID=6269 RepID=A0A0M3K615_ANISI|nr:unnamed protein product [Anisakis simplex]
MSIVWLLTSYLTVLSPISAVIHIPIRSSGSLRKNLIEAGQWDHYRARLVAGAFPRIQNLEVMNDNFYLATVHIGTPPQSLEVVPDTGSSDLWIVSTSCWTDACLGFYSSGYTKHHFSPCNSSTFTNLEKPFRLFYGSGASSGYLGTDVIKLDGFEYGNQTFGLANEIDQVFGSQPIDGIMGLAWPKLSSFGALNPVENMLPQLEQPLFSVWMESSESMSSNGSGGQITYGGYDVEHCDSHINWVPLTRKYYWQFTIEGFELPSFYMVGETQAISDTGTSWLGVPPKYLSTIISVIGGYYNAYYSMYVINCSVRRTAPDFTIFINGHAYNIPPDEYIVDLSLGDDLCGLTIFDGSSEELGVDWILGDTFIRSVCNIYDIGNARIGFAKPIRN